MLDKTRFEMMARYNKRISNKDLAGAIASFILAFASLVAAIYHTQTLLPLLENGKHAKAVIVEIKSGAKNSKKAVYQFFTDSGNQHTSADVFQMYIIRLHKGEEISVIYDPEDPDTVTADLGIWVWQGTIIFFSSFIILFVLGILIWRYKPENR